MARNAVDAAAKELDRQSGKVPKKAAPNHPYQIGANYFIRLVTHHHTGKLIAVYEHELVLEQAAWIADDGRFMQAAATGSFNEVEPFPDGPVIIGRGAIIDAFTVSFPLPRSQK